MPLHLSRAGRKTAELSAEQGEAKQGLGQERGGGEVFPHPTSARRREPSVRFSLPGGTWLLAGRWHPAPPGLVRGCQVFSCEERTLFLDSFHGRCTTAGRVMELPEDNSRVHRGKGMLQWHRSNLGQALSPRELLSTQHLQDAPLPSLPLSRNSQPAWECPQTGTRRQPCGLLGNRIFIFSSQNSQTG